MTVAVLGLTFKPGTDDLREAPSLVNVPVLLDEECRIQAWDPIGVDKFREIYPEGILYCSTIEEALSGADLCLIFTEWEEVRTLTPESYQKNMRRAIVLDGRNCYRPEIFAGSGVVYDSVGRKTVAGN